MSGPGPMDIADGRGGLEAAEGSASSAPPSETGDAVPEATKRPDPPASPRPDTPSEPRGGDGLWAVLVRFMRRLRPGETVRDQLEEIIEERDTAEAPITADERHLLANTLRLRDCSVADVMVPRIDIAAVDASAGLAEVIEASGKGGHSRLPVFRGSLDDVIGMVHMKDLLVWRGRDADFKLKDVVRRVLFVAPSMKVMDLMLEMRVSRSHMALVVDEFGGVDGLVTIEDLVEEIVGEIEDEHDRGQEPLLCRESDGSFTADARVTIGALEEAIGPAVSEEERESIDTLGGLVFSLAGRVPIRGELVAHPSGMEFEVLEADPRRIKHLRLRRAARSKPGTDAAP